VKKFLALLLILILALSLLTACGGINIPADDVNDIIEDQSPLAAFAQFGVDLEQIKPDLADPYETAIAVGNRVDSTVYYRKAAWMEKSSQSIDDTAAHAYNERVFDYIKTISADGNCYQNKTMSGNETVAEHYADIRESLLISLSFRVDGMWVDVYFEYTSPGQAVGVTMNGTGEY